MDEAVDAPVLVTGCARSRTSMVAGALYHCGAFGGEMYGPGVGNPRGFFENKSIRDGLVKEILRFWGADTLGVRSLPEPGREHPPIGENVKALLLADGYEGGPWFYKDAKLALMWHLWHEAFPEAKWIVCRRDKEEIIDSCLKAPFMRQHSTDRGFWERWIEETEARLEALKETADCFEVRGRDDLREAIAWVGLDWTERAEKFVSRETKSETPVVVTKGRSALTSEERARNIRLNCAHDFPTVKGREEPLVIVGGGPSLERNLRTIRAHKGKILALNGAYSYLMEKGVVPWGMMLLDPREDCAEFVKPARRDVLYFIASHCDPGVFEALKKSKVHLFHAYAGEGETQALSELGRDNDILIGGGSTVGARALNLGTVLGFREFHLYGLDSCYEQGKAHCYPQKQRDSSAETVLNVHVNDREFVAAAWMYQQALNIRQFLREHAEAVFPPIRVEVHGEGLLAELLNEPEERTPQ